VKNRYKKRATIRDKNGRLMPPRKTKLEVLENYCRGKNKINVNDAAAYMLERYRYGGTPVSLAQMIRQLGFVKYDRCIYVRDRSAEEGKV